MGLPRPSMIIYGNGPSVVVDSDDVLAQMRAFAEVTGISPLKFNSQDTALIVKSLLYTLNIPQRVIGALNFEVFNTCDSYRALCHHLATQSKG